VVTGGAQRHSHDHGTQTMSSSLMKESNALVRSNPKTMPPKFLRHAPHRKYYPAGKAVPYYHESYASPLLEVMVF
jgi:hypothetical protein